MHGRQQAWTASDADSAAGNLPLPAHDDAPPSPNIEARRGWLGGRTQSKPQKLQQTSSSTEMRHERRRTAAHLLAIDPDGATDLGHLRSRFMRRQRTKEAAEVFHGGSTNEGSVANISASLKRSDSFNSATSGFGGGSFRQPGGGSFRNFGGSFLSNLGLDGQDGGSLWGVDQYGGRGGSWMGGSTRGGSWMSYADDHDSDAIGGPLSGFGGMDALTQQLEAAKQQLLQDRAGFHREELAGVLRLQQQAGSAGGGPLAAADGIQQAVQEYKDKGGQYSSAG